jgi:hypothetical protein
MKKKLCILLAAFPFSYAAQTITSSQKEKVEQLFKKDSVVKFTFTVHSVQEISPLSKMVAVDGTKGNLVYAHANKDQFSKFIVKNISYQVEEPVKKPIQTTEASMRGLPPEKQQKLDELFKTQTMVRFSFTIKSLQEICSLATIVDIDETKGLLVNAHANKEQFADFLMKDYEYAVAPTKKVATKAKTNTTKKVKPKTVKKK